MFMKIVTVYTGGTCKTVLFILIETESKTFREDQFLNTF